MTPLNARFVLEPSQPGDGPPEWPKGADHRILGIACPLCGHESRDQALLSPHQRIACSECGWKGQVPF